MKQLPILFLALCAISCQNKPGSPSGTAGRVWLSPSNQYLDTVKVDPIVQEAAADTIDWDAEVDITRHWYPEDRIAHLFERPSRQMVANWKGACDKNTLHSVDNLELSRFAYGVRHLTAFYDLNNLTVDDSEEDNFIMWRLAQFTGDSITPPTLGTKLELLLHQIEKLLEFDAQFQVEHNMKACMEEYLQHRYNRIAVREIAKELPALIARYVEQDYSLSEQYGKAYSEAFETVNYYDAMASSYPVTYGESETNEAMMVRSAVNAWVYPDSSGLVGKDSRYATIARVLDEYDAFSASLEEDELCLPIEQRRAALRKEKTAWKKWMDYRTGISSRLPEPLRSAFDHATRSICRRKLITLKNRYNFFGYMSADYEDSLLSFDCTDQQLASYGKSTTGIVPDFSPYYYDPAWPIHYSESGRTLVYFPRDTTATHFKIPEGVQNIGDRAFLGNKHLTELILPEHVRNISVCSFHACAELQRFTIRGPVKEIPWRAFDGCPKLETVDLPATVESIAGFAFAGCKKLRKLTVRALEPPVFEMDNSESGTTDFDWAFNDVNLSKCALYVPAGSITKYRNAIGWNRFKNVHAL